MKFYPWRFATSLVILGLAFSLRLYHLDFQSIWWDEGHSIFVASQPIPQIPTLPAMDVHPPAYFVLLHLWLGLAGQSEFALRYLSVWFSMLTVALLWRFAQAILRSNYSFVSSAPLPLCSSAPFLAALFAALSPLYVAYAQEVRSYAMITFLALASTFTLWRIFFSGRRWAVVSYVGLTALCLYTHYFTIFLLIFHNLAWLVWALSENKNRVGRVVTWTASQLGVLLLFAPQLLLALRQVTGYTNPNLSPPGLTEFILRSWQAYTVGLTIDPLPAAWGMAITAAILLVTLGLLLFKITTPSTKWTSFFHLRSSILHLLSSFLFLLAWLLIPLAAYFIVLQRQPSFEPRYLILVTPALFLLLALGVDNASRFTLHVLRLTLYALHFTPYVFLAILLFIFLFSLSSYYTNETYFKDDSAGVADWLAAETTGNDVVFVDVPHPFHYYTAKGQIAAPTRYLFVDIHTAAATLTREAAGRDRFFWITWRGSDTDPRGVIPFLAQKYGEKLGQRDFRGYHVEWFSLPDSNTSFSLPTDLDPISATFGDVLRLDGAAYGGYPPSGQTTSARHPAWATLHFTLLRQTSVDYKVSLRLRGQDGHIAGQIDKDLLNDRHFRTSAWPLADPALNQAINVYTLAFAPDTSPGSYRLEVVVYNRQPPYPSEGVTGAESRDGVAALIGNLTVIP